MKQLAEELHAEPALGLAAGSAGLDVVLPMLKQARDYLTEEGILVVEVGYTQPALERALPNVPFMWLDFEHGGQGVFLLTAQQLEDCQSDFEQALG